MTRLRPLFAVVVLSAALLGACGRGDGQAVGPPPRVPRNVVPATLEVGPGLSVTPNTSKEVKKAFAIAGARSLAFDGAVWEVRLGSQLVGVLQLTSLNDRVDTTKSDDRKAVRRDILSGSESAFDIATTPVWVTKDAGRGTYIWFGRQMLGVLQMKSSLFDIDDAATRMVTTLLQSEEWPELPPEAFEDDL
jgi:hypothetical protein